MKKKVLRELIEEREKEALEYDKVEIVSLEPSKKRKKKKHKRSGKWWKQQ